MAAIAPVVRVAAAASAPESRRGVSGGAVGTRLTPTEEGVDANGHYWSEVIPDEELALMRTAFDAKGLARRTAVEDIMWALLNTREFVFNH